MVEMIKTRKLQSHFSTRRAVVEEGGVQPLAKDIITHLRAVEFLNLFPRATFTSETQVKKKNRIPLEICLPGPNTQLFLVNNLGKVTVLPI